jgi:hypothetical protein
MLAPLAAESIETEMVMIDRPIPKRIASHRGEAALIEAVARTKGGPSSKLYIDFDVKPLILIKEEGHGE